MAKKKESESIVEKVIDEVKEVAEKVIDETKDKVKEGEEIVEKAVKKAVKKVKESVSEKDGLSEKEMEEAAEAESLATETSLDAKKKAILAKAKKLAEKLEKTETEDLKEKVKAKKKSDTLLPLDDYVKSGIYLGTRVVTPDMRPYVYRRRADGLAILNTDLIDEKMKEGIEYLSKFNPDEVIIVCKRQAGWKAVEMFSKLTGIRVFTKKYPAGILTNIALPEFFEVEMAVICDSWLDKNALNDIRKVGKKILMVSDTNNFARYGDQIIIGNNKSNKSLGLMFYLLARGYLKAKGMSTDNVPDLEWWTGEKEEEAMQRKESEMKRRVEFISASAVEGV